MDVVWNFISSNGIIIVFVLCISYLIMFVFLIIVSFNLRKLKRKYRYFMGTLNDDNVSVEKLLTFYIDELRTISSEHAQILSNFKNIEHNMSNCFQKIGIVRYNPFEEMGGNLCFTVAILDQNDNGVVFNGIHSRSGSFTYAKPIEHGKSSYVLSDEEIEAVNIAIKK